MIMLNELTNRDAAKMMEEARIIRRYLQMPNTDHATIAEKWQGLRAWGYSVQEADRLCEPKEIDREQVLRDVAEICKRELRMLRKENPRRHRTPTAAELHALPDFSEVVPLKPDLDKPARPILNSPGSNSTPTTPQPRFVGCDELLEDVLDWQDEDEKLNYELRYYYEHRHHSND